MTLSPKIVSGHALVYLMRLGIIEEGSQFVGWWVRDFNSSITLPTPENVAAATENVAVLRDEYPWIRRLSGAAGFGCNSLNEQIVQAYAIAEAIE